MLSFENRFQRPKDLGFVTSEKKTSNGTLVFESERNPGHPILDPKKGFMAALKDAKIENFRFHDLRHTAGTRLAEAGADVFAIKDILGHASIQTSAIYVHATDKGNRRALSALERYAENFGQKLVKSGRREPHGSRPPTPPDVRFRIRRFTLKIETFVVDPAVTPNLADQRMTSGMLRSYVMLPHSTTNLARCRCFSRLAVSPVRV
jgi:hypothetical protein